MVNIPNRGEFLKTVTLEQIRKLVISGWTFEDEGEKGSERERKIENAVASTKLKSKDKETSFRECFGLERLVRVYNSSIISVLSIFKIIFTKKLKIIPFFN
uniref:Uncharacterized protein n=1 Tax=Graphocephala atropunctata TaxID=36148 RepID=A0A1B6KKR8_9HEMI